MNIEEGKEKVLPSRVQPGAPYYPPPQQTTGMYQGAPYYPSPQQTTGPYYPSPQQTTGTYQGAPYYPPPQQTTGTYQGAPNYPPQSGAGLSQTGPAPGYSASGTTEHDRLPCCGCGYGWCLFILGFFLGIIPWYVGAILLLCRRNKDKREKPGCIACAIMAIIGTVLVVVAVVVAVRKRHDEYEYYG